MHTIFKSTISNGAVEKAVLSHEFNGIFQINLCYTLHSTITTSLTVEMLEAFFKHIELGNLGALAFWRHSLVINIEIKVKLGILIGILIS